MGYQRRVHGIPQIRPINWFILFILFNLGFYILIVKNFFLINKIIKVNNIIVNIDKNNKIFEL